jgi:hypothetical protein
VFLYRSFSFLKNGGGALQLKQNQQSSAAGVSMAAAMFRMVHRFPGSCLVVLLRIVPLAPLSVRRPCGRHKNKLAFLAVERCANEPTLFA